MTAGTFAFLGFLAGTVAVALGAALLLLPVTHDEAGQ